MTAESANSTESKTLKTSLAVLKTEETSDKDNSTKPDYLKVLKDDWANSKGKCSICGRTHGDKPCFYLSDKLKTFGNTEDLPWNKTKQGIAYYKLGFYCAYKTFPKGYVAATQSVQEDAEIVNTQVRKTKGKT